MDSVNTQSVVILYWLAGAIAGFYGGRDGSRSAAYGMGTAAAMVFGIAPALLLDDIDRSPHFMGAVYAFAIDTAIAVAALELAYYFGSRH